MKFSLWLLGAFTAFSKVLAEEVVVDESPSEQVQIEEVELTNYHINYVVEEFPDSAPDQALEIYIGDSITLQYEVSNEEDSTITIVGLGGAFLDPLTGVPSINLTANSVEHLEIQPQTSVSLRQRIPLRFANGDYVLAPTVFVAFQDQLKGLPARGQRVSITEAPVSIFDPRLLFLEILLISVFGYVVYNYYGTYLKKYYKNNAPIDGKVTASATGVESSWIPKNYHPVQKKSKVRKY